MDNFKIDIDDNYIIISLKYSSFLGVRKFYIKREWFNKEINEKIISWLKNDIEHISLSVYNKTIPYNGSPEYAFKLVSNEDGSIFYNMNVDLSFECFDINIEIVDERHMCDIFECVHYSREGKISHIISEYFTFRV